MTENNENTQPRLSANNRSLFEDIRNTLSGRPEPKSPLPMSDTTEDKVDDTVTINYVDPYGESIREATVEVSEDRTPETSAQLGGEGRPGSESGGNWRSAEAQASTTGRPPGGSSSGDSTSRVPPPVGNPYTAPAPSRPPLRVGLLVWAGVLAILALLIVLQLFLAVSSGPVILGILMAVFGAILIGVGVNSGNRSRKNPQNPTKS